MIGRQSKKTKRPKKKSEKKTLPKEKRKKDTLKRKTKKTSREQLLLYKNAYALKFTKMKQIQTILVYTAAFSGFIFLLTGYKGLAIFAAIFAAIYAIKVVIPYELRSEYETSSLRARNKFVNTITQIMTSPNRTTLEALATTVERLDGELMEDLRGVLVGVGSANAAEIQQIFKDFGKKYEKDIIFYQYLDQLITAFVEGRGNLDTLKDLKTYHNDIKKRQENYELQKKKSAREVYIMFGFIAGFVAMLGFAFGRDQYLLVFAQQPVGWLSNGLFLLMEGSIYRKFYKYFRDNEILEV